MAKSDIETYLKLVKEYYCKEYSSQELQEIIQDTRKKYDKFCKENDDESKELKVHTHKHIYPAIALHQVLMERGVDREKSYQQMIDFSDWRYQKTAQSIRNLMKIPGFYKLVPGIFYKAVRKMFGTEAGFRHRYHDCSKGTFCMDMMACPYFEVCRKNGCPEIAKVFCHVDDICYGNMHPKLIWGRTKTLARGGDCCDFKITISK